MPAPNTCLVKCLRGRHHRHTLKSNKVVATT